MCLTGARFRKAEDVDVEEFKYHVRVEWVNAAVGMANRERPIFLGGIPKPNSHVSFLTKFTLLR